MLFARILAALLPLAGPARAAYDAFPKAVTGSARTVALAGAIAADPDGYEAIFFNPAGLSGMAGGGIDFGSDANSVDNFVVDLDDPKSRSLNVPLNYSYYGVRWVGDGWGFGLGASTPFHFDDEFDSATATRVRRNGKTVTVVVNDTHEIVNEANTYALAVAKSFDDGRLGVGVAFNYTRATEEYRFKPVVSPSSTAFTRSALGDAVNFDVGVLWQPRRWLRAGLVYKNGYKIGFPAGSNQGIPNQLQPFQDLKTPDRWRVGLRLAPWDNVRLDLQGRLVQGMAGTYVVGSGLFPNDPGASVESGRRATLDGGWGLEYVPYDKDDLTFKLWAGGYLEDSNVAGGYTRYHRTAGLSFAPWFLSLSAAVDDAELYNNFVVGLGVDLLKAAQRASQRYGWKLPI